MQTMRDMLVWYNNLDVVPFIEALSKQKEFYQGQELDMGKDAISVPGLAEKIMFKHARDVSGKKSSRRSNQRRFPANCWLLGSNRTSQRI
jgi:hypothetical protein